MLPTEEHKDGRGGHKTFLEGGLKGDSEARGAWVGNFDPADDKVDEEAEEEGGLWSYLSGLF